MPALLVLMVLKVREEKMDFQDHKDLQDHKAHNSLDLRENCLVEMVIWVYLV